MNAALSATFAFYLLSSVPAAAQPPDAPVPLGVRLAASPLGDLPSTDNVYSILDTAVPEVIADRIDTGGLSTGDPSHIGAHGSSWTQTLFQIGDVDITDPMGSGTPLLLPRNTMWEDVEVAKRCQRSAARRLGISRMASPGAFWSIGINPVATSTSSHIVVRGSRSGVPLPSGSVISTSPI